MSETAEAAPPEQEPIDDKPDPADPATSIDAIKAQFETDRVERERRYQASLRSAQAQVANVTEQLQTVTQERETSDFASVSNALDAELRQADLIRGQMKAAGEAGDFEKVADLSVQAGQVGARITQLEAGKREMEARRNQQLREPAQQPRQQQPQDGADPIEADLATRDARAATWIRSHVGSDGRPLFYTDPAFQARVVGAHSLAMGSGLTQNSPEYFQFVERTAGLTNPEQPAPPNGGQRQIPQAAPGRQTASLHSQTRPRGDHIPKEFVDHAMKVWGFTKKENGRQVPDMQLVSQSWAEALRMEQATGSEGFKRGNPWRNAR